MADEAKRCEDCGSLFQRDVRNTRAYWARARFCSSACAGRTKTRMAAENRPPLREVFSKWFECSDGCWLWRGARDESGYGIFSYACKTRRAATVALELDGRPVHAGMYACHTCDNPPCVRPDHLYPGTPKQNMADAIARNRLNPGRKAKLLPDEVRAIRSVAGTHSEIAAAFGVSPSLVSMVKSRKVWSRLQ